MDRHLKTALQLLPELLLMLTAGALVYAGANADPSRLDALFIVATLEGAMLMASATLIDIASRIKRPPVGWVAVVLVLGLLLMNPYIFTLLYATWIEGGLWIFVFFAWSIIERFSAMWTLPKAKPIEKIRRRTLIFDRLYVGLVLALALVAVWLLNAWQNDGSAQIDFAERALPWLVLIYFLIASINVWRVQQPHFAARPRSLLPSIDQSQGSDLSDL